MLQFEYRAVDASGSIVAGRLHAAHLQDLMAQLGRMGLTLVRATAKRQRQVRVGKLTRRDLMMLFFHLEMLARAGVPVPTAMADLRDSAQEPALRQLAAGLCERINNGETVANAMAAYPKTFTPSVVTLIRVGEATGELPKVMLEILKSLKWADELASKTKKILAYPAFVSVVISAVVGFLMVYLVPQMTAFITSMHQELPMHTKALIATSEFIRNCWWVILSLPPLVVAVTAYCARRFAKVRHALDACALRLPVIGEIHKKIIMARIADTLGLMYRSGIPMLDAIEYCTQVSTNVVAMESVTRVRKSVSEGVGIADAFAAQALFPPLVIRMLRVGESAGGLDEALGNVSYFFVRDIDATIGKIEAMIEPALTVILGLILGWIMLSVMGPIYATISTLKI
jgi:type IV pilus assembly protein PilC